MNLRLVKPLKCGITAEKAGELYSRILQALTTSPHTVLGKLDYLSAGEKDHLLYDLNDTAATYPDTKTLTNLFEEQVLKTPSATALVFKGRELTYHEVNEKANAFGNYLREKYTVGADDLVGIKLERSEWMIISILGVLKSGGAYVPMDPEFPAERITYMTSDSVEENIVTVGDKWTAFQKENLP